MKLMPQEIQVRYILPALRKEYAKCMVGCHGMSQKQAAERLGVTEAAISQYLGDKRATAVSFPDAVLEMIRESCKKLSASDLDIMDEMYRISMSPEVKKTMCVLHKLHNPEIREGCALCLGGPE